MNVAILTIPAQRHRLFALSGHLKTIGFPVWDTEHIRIYNGADVNDFSSRRDVAEAMWNDDFARWGDLVASDDHSLNDPDYHNVCVEWGLLNILRKVLETGEDTLILENDAFFKNGVRYDDIVQHWEDLKALVPYDDIHIAMLMHYETLYNYDDAGNATTQVPSHEGERINDFWQTGARSGGQVANIFTPQGAHSILSEKPALPTLEWYLAENPTLTGVYSSIENQLDWQNAFFDFDSPHDPRSESVLFDYFKGENLCI